MANATKKKFSFVNIVFFVIFGLALLVISVWYCHAWNLHHWIVSAVNSK